MSVKLLPNLPIENLTAETDYLGLIEKGNLIASFLKGNKDQFNEIKMFSLYGEWGSGKSSLMKYLEKELKGDFNTYFFEAWEYEKDENLAFSLLEYIDTNSQKDGEPFYKDVLKYGGRILRGLAKSVKINAPLYPNGPSLEFDAAGLVNELNQNENLTFYQILDKFKKEFVIMEDRIKAQTQKEYNIIFVDDLDRCEPEQVLNLLSAIKLFFTYGNRTIFFCGIDKKAVEEAVKTKYGEIVKANEYLEKIFDISFTMPIHQDIEKLITHFLGNQIYTFAGYEKSITYWVKLFFIEINFTNPRRIKKVLNKLQFVRNVESISLDEYPNIGGNNLSIFELILVLYLLILHEFYNDLFHNFLDLSIRQKSFNKVHENNIKKDGKLLNHPPIYLTRIKDMDISDLPLNSFKNNLQVLNNDNFIANLCPSVFIDLIETRIHGQDGLKFQKFVVDIHHKIEGDFLDFLINYIYILQQDGNLSDFSLKQIKELLSKIM